MTGHGQSIAPVRLDMDPRIAQPWAGLADAMVNMVREDPSFSAQLSVHINGRPVFDAAVGDALSRDEITGVFSCTKAMAVLVLGMLIDEGLLELDQNVAVYWPEFATAGKNSITVRHALSHQAGIIGPDDGFASSELASRSGVRIIERLSPSWRVGSGHGYHGLSLGIVMDELCFRVTGRPLKAVFNERIAAPHNADFFIGLPHAFERRYRPVVPMARLTPPGPGPLRQALHVRDLPGGLPHLPNDFNARRIGSSGAGGIANARGLSRIYDAVIGDRIVSPETRGQLTREQVDGVDRVLGERTRFGVVFQLPTPQLSFGGPNAFGHDGVGGCLGYADPDSGVAFGFVCSPMSMPAGVDVRGLHLAAMVDRLASHGRI